MGSQQIGIQIRNQETIELQQEFEMASTLQMLLKGIEVLHRLH